MGEELALVIVSSLVILGGTVLLMILMWQRGRQRELAMRERLALIERGLVPSPETDPGRFEALMGRKVGPVPASERATRFKTTGTIIMGFGVALMLLIGFAGNAGEVAVGIGGGILAIGVAVFVNSFFVAAAESGRRDTLPTLPPGSGLSTRDAGEGRPEPPVDR